MLTVISVIALIILGLIVYVKIACVTYGIFIATAYYEGKTAPICAGIFWPITLILAVSYGLIRFVGKDLKMIGKALKWIFCSCVKLGKKIGEKIFANIPKGG